MNNYLNKSQKWMAVALLLIVSIALNACGLSGDALLGAAGLETETPAPLETPIPAETPIPPAFGHIIFVSNREGQMSLYMTAPDGQDQTRLTSPDSEAIDPHVSPDGTRVAFVSNSDGNMDIYILELATRNITR